MGDRFDSMGEWRRENFAEFQRTVALGAQLWGNAEYLKHQLELPSPEIPPGTTRKDLRTLEWLARERLSTNLKLAPNSLALEGPNIVVGGEQFTVTEAMCEIVRRAIAALCN
jgi:hypothetical protein